jgi:membrane-bound metal-dependent hydrolase YbcI (DUF457 family)
VIIRHHVSLAIGSVLILYFPLIATDPEIVMAIAAGTVIGVVLPDIHMKKPRRHKELFCPWIIVLIFKKTLLQPYLWIYRKLSIQNVGTEDKRLTHSLPGLFFITLVSGCLICFTLWVFPFSQGTYPLEILLSGIVIGFILHFLEDICTKKGVMPLFPFNDRFRISGSIRPCNRSDRRILCFQVGLIGTVALLFLLYYSGACLAYLNWPVSIAALVICTIVMMHCSNVRITRTDSRFDP